MHCLAQGTDDAMEKGLCQQHVWLRLPLCHDRSLSSHSLEPDYFFLAMALEITSAKSHMASDLSRHDLRHQQHASHTASGKRALTTTSQFTFEFRQYVKQISYQAIIRNAEDRRFGILVDGNNHLGILHSSLVLNSTGNTYCNV